MTESLPIAVIVYTGHAASDPVVAEFARRLQQRGLKVRGLRQEDGPAAPGRAPATTLIDLANGERHRISLDLGPGAASCKVDTSAVAAVSRVLRDALSDDPDLVIVSRFGTLEAEGRGFSAEMLALMEAGVPLLTVTAQKHLEAWRRFTGGAAAELPVEIGAIEAWFAGLPPRARAAAPRHGAAS